MKYLAGGAFWCFLVLLGTFLVHVGTGTGGNLKDTLDEYATGSLILGVISF